MTTKIDLEKKISELNELVVKFCVHKHAMADVVKKLEDPHRVEIPQFVADWIEEEKKKSLVPTSYSNEVFKWCSEPGNSLVYLQAWVNGYVIKQKRYEFPLPHLKTTDGEQQYLTHKNGTFFACRKMNGYRQSWKNDDLKYVPAEYLRYKVEVVD